MSIRRWIYTDRLGRHFYDFTDSSERDGPAKILADLKGFLQPDAYPGHDWLFLSGEVTEVARWAQVLHKSPMGKAIHCALARWKVLNVHVTDGRLEIDNDRSERAMKPLAVGRKNWRFVQNEAGGRSAAVIMSLIVTAEAAGVNVKLYLRDVLRRIATESDVKKLLPHAWKELFEAEVLGRRAETVELLVADQRRQWPSSPTRVCSTRRLPLSVERLMRIQ